MCRPVFAALAACAALCATLAAQQGGTPQTPPPKPPAHQEAPDKPSAQTSPGQPAAGQLPPVTFKVEVNYVEVDTLVTDRQGQVVRDLTRDDFEGFEDGRPTPLELF